MEEADSGNSGYLVQPGRLIELDGLRLIGVGAVFAFHCCRVFAFGSWYVVDPDRSMAATVLATFLLQWMMPLLFAVAGSALCLSLRHRSVGQLLRERALRLLVPFFGLGLLLLGPFQIYVDRLSRGAFAGTFLEFYPQVFDGLDAFGGNFPWHGVHLWFLPVLFALTLLWLPLLRRRPGGSRLEQTAQRLRPLWILVISPLALTGADLLGEWVNPGFLRAMGGWTPFTYLVCLGLGAALVVAPKMRSAVRSATWIAVAIAAGTSSLDLLIRYAWRPPIGYASAAFVGVLLLRNVCAFAWVLALFGVAGRFFRRENGFVRYMTRAVLPLYILHQPVIVAVAHYGTTRWQAPAELKLPVLAAASLASTLLLYEFAIRRIKPLRLAFGMRIEKRPRQPGSQAEPT